MNKKGNLDNHLSIRLHLTSLTVYERKQSPLMINQRAQSVDKLKIVQILPRQVCTFVQTDSAGVRGDGASPHLPHWGYRPRPLLKELLQQAECLAFYSEAF